MRLVDGWPCGIETIDRLVCCAVPKNLQQAGSRLPSRLLKICRQIQNSTESDDDSISILGRTSLRRRTYTGQAADPTLLEPVDHAAFPDILNFAGLAHVEQRLAHEVFTHADPHLRSAQVSIQATFVFCTSITSHNTRSGHPAALL